MDISAKRGLATTIYSGVTEGDNSLKRIIKSNKSSINNIEFNKPAESFSISHLLKLIKNLTSKKEINKSFISQINVPKGVNEVAKKIIKSAVTSESLDAWNKLVSIAVESNQGLGNSEKGYLVFSEEHGFINYFNSELSAEENQMISSKSLEAQISIEKMESKSSNDVPINLNPEINNTEIKAEEGVKKKSFFDKVKDIFSFVSKGVPKIRDLIKNASKIADKIGDFADYLKTSDYSFVRKTGGYIEKGLHFLSKLF